MHDHPAVATIYVYLNNSGVVDISHEDGPTIHRPPTRTGAFRVSPGAFERHSIQNTSDLPSDFLRIELKRIPVGSLPAEFRGPAPNSPYHSTDDTPYDNPVLRVVRDVCVVDEKCTAASEAAASVLVLIPLNPTSKSKPNSVLWVPANKDVYDNKEVQALAGKDEPYELLRIVLLKH
jgi:hypothetical protein